ncbi:hypothetical protein A2Y83_03650 [Candidatus Falkowbacteria bacterium RBG_13_39_14]|uniref:Uncharacterized protein n=1 Tax=Candidatus Falkowbacteria bacterium RBG_13_39_14 TaxID=1797985 RepID=A0A1F5S2X1_9BACT|nr:MAG: hypothetical protein A2Y83_03650 [Candidatus Falkowbacteria bacterium RBG_13_39_14]
MGYNCYVSYLHDAIIRIYELYPCLRRQANAPKTNISEYLDGNLDFSHYSALQFAGLWFRIVFKKPPYKAGGVALYFII